jgi:energy-coupling factor transporter ATP-binding protein EcfA2
MISELKIRNFKSLESIDLKLGHFNLLVGANASGKSNFLDALRFLQGVGNGLTITEILDGKPPSATSFKWVGIRGGSKFVAFRRKYGSTANSIEFEALIPETNLYGIRRTNLRFEPWFSPETNKFERFFFDADRRLWHDNEQQRAHLEGQLSEGLHASVFYTAEAYTNALKQRYPDLSPQEAESRNNITPATFNLDEYSIFVAHVLDALFDMQFLDPLPAVLKGYSSKVARLGENGEGFAALIREIENKGSKPALLEWLKELRPDEVSDLSAIPGAVNDFMAAITEGNTEFPAPATSDGTLRFIALAAAFFQPSMPKILVIEEIEKGLHPSRLRLLLELMRSQSKRTGTQVFATTHSPTLLNWLTEEDRKTTFVCTREAESGATKMRSLAEVPRLEELIRKNYNLDQLFEEGWLESVLHES